MRAARIALLLALAACGGGEEASAPAAAPLRTGPVRRLLLARPFALAEPYPHVWRREQPAVSEGWLLVLEVDPSMTVPRQRAMPVILVDDQTAECVNFGQPSGNVVAIVPGPVSESGMSAWFGPPDLPESVDSSWIARAKAGVRAEERASFTAEEIAAARGRGGMALEAAGRVELERAAAGLILEFSPEERELAQSLLVPLIK